jgi:hypothetical protein
MSEAEMALQARRDAQARRQRILDAANNRMDVVNGVPTAEEEEEAARAKASAGSKMAAARRRRFQKKAPSTDAPALPEAPTEPVPLADKDSAQPVPVDETPASLPIDDTPNETTDVEDDESKIKYVGVAKMRRRMLQERKQKESRTDGANGTVKLETVKLPPKIKVSKLPILMHALTVLLLFFAGLEVGLQQAEVDYHPANIEVHTTLAPREGLRVLRRFAKSEHAGKPSLKPLDAKVSASESLAATAEEEDEFYQIDENNGADATENLDPLFGVDLDRLTEGPGLLSFLGRLAIKAHRVNLSIFYYLPQRIFYYIVDTIKSLLETPPILMLIALFIRQIVAHQILGAGLPDASQQLEGQNQTKDVLGMVKGFVSGFILKSFPTGVKLYGAWVHLRADMYVILCGLIVGVTWCHTASLELTGVGDAVPKPSLVGTGDEL